MRISDYVERDLEARIYARSDLPERPTIGAIAAIYGVSTTPVRSALQGLIAKKLVAKQSNGRLRWATSPGRRKQLTPPEQPTDWEAVLAREVILMSLRGEGRFLREESMAERHGIGRTQLRRVFAHLAGAGLLEHLPRRGWRVPVFRSDEMDAYVVVRETLEVQALELARERMDPAEIERMIDGNSPAAVAAEGIDNRLHGYFIEASGNRYIGSFFESHGRYYNTLFDYAALGAQVVAEMAGQHLEILNNVARRRWPAAKRALAHHIQSQKPVMEAMIVKLAHPPGC